MAAYNSLDIRTSTPYTAKFLANLMGIQSNAITLNYDPNSEIDMVLTISDSWANSGVMP